MKIHTIRLRNLNSLADEHTIDLQEGLGHASLFLIMGPTGSGKSTLMDAVSLALFGRTPRLDNPARHGSDGTDSMTEGTVVSHGAGDALAEVVFSKLGPEGRQRYRATWQVGRAHGRADGRLQRVQRTLEEWLDGDWEALHGRSDAAKSYDPAFEAVLEGFTVDDFQRSMLLAQGQFDAFLDAKPSERASILERLSNTSEYKHLGWRAAQLRRAHESRIGKLEQRLAGQDTLSPEARQALEREVDAASGRAAQAREQQQQVEVCVRWREEDDTHADQIAKGQAAVHAVSEAREQARPRLEALAEHERCAPAFEAHDLVGAAHTRHAGVDKELAEATARVPTANRTRTETHTAAARADEAHKATSEALRGLRPLVEAALTTGRESLRLRTEAADATKEAEAASSKADQIARDAEAAKSTLERARAQAEAAAEAVAEHALDAQLTEAWATLEAPLRALHQQAADLAEGRARLRTEQATLTEHREAFARAQAAHAAQRAARITPLQQAASEAAAALSAELDGELFPAPHLTGRREVVQTARRRLQALDTAAQAVARVDEAQEARHTRAAALAEAKKASTSAAEVAARHRATRDGARERRATAAAHHQALSRVAAVVLHRDTLVEGEPCPLCGALDHPAAHDSDEAVRAEVEAAEAAVRQAEQAVRAAEATVSTADKAHAAAEAAVVAAVGELQRAHQGLERAGAAAAPLLDAAALPADATARVVDQAREAAAEQQRRAEAAVAALQALVDARDRTRDALSAATEALAAEASKLDTQRARLEQRAEDLAARTQQLDALAAQHSEARTARLAVVTALGFDQDATPAAWLEQAIRRRDAHRGRVDAQRRATAAVETATAAQRELDRRLDDARAARDKAQRRAAEATARSTTAHAKAAEAAGILRTRWAEVPPMGPAHHELAQRPPAELLRAYEQHRGRLEDAATAARDKARVAAEQATALASRVSTLTEQVSSLAGELERARAHRRATLDTLGIEDVDALVARRLAPAAAEAARRLHDDLTTRQASAAATVAERHRAREAHHEHRPAHLGEDVTLDTLRGFAAAAAEVTTRVEARAQAARQRLAVDDANAGTRAKLQGQLDTALSEARVWRRLHALIGTNDGERFKEFAQALNLGQLLDEANIHLERLTPRYRLVPLRQDDLPTLDFLVHDSFQQGIPRNPKTLSGGERFLISLALALGLSDLRTVSMPIETLLLDEGFGTLDPATLDMALAALQQLQADGRQVGIISHVVGLAERIEARIILTPDGGGRSRLHVEVG